MPAHKIHPPIVFHELERLGEGAIGSVSRVMDLQSGRILAVKIIPVKELGIEKNLKETAKREVEMIANLCHVSRTFLSALEYLLTAMNRHTSLTLCILKAGKWKSR